MSNEVNNEKPDWTIEPRGCGGGEGVESEEQDKANAEAARSASEDLPEYDTNALFAGRREIVIHHAGAAYRMKITRQGKLILNK
jgi:hemin uptake protein HemP